MVCAVIFPTIMTNSSEYEPHDNVNAVKTMNDISNKILYVILISVCMRGGGGLKREEGAYFFCFQKRGLLERELNTEVTVLVIPIFKLVFYKCTLFGILVE